MKRIVIFASGRGSNAKKIIQYFENHPDIEVSLVVSNKRDAGVFEVAKVYNIPTKLITRNDLNGDSSFTQSLLDNQIDLIVLAGFLWLIPSSFIQQFPNKIINIHPSLLPKYGGKGMYGQNVHKAVKSNHETSSGITIHYVNEKFDEGKIIFQSATKINPTDDVTTIADKVLALEHEHYPRVIEALLAN